MSLSTAQAGPRPARDARQSWRLLLCGLALCGLALGGLFWNEIIGAYRVWTGSATYGHCLLVLPVALYLIWGRRAALAGLAPRPDFRVLLLLPLLSLAWLLVAVLGVLEAQQFVFMAMVELLLLAVLGWRIYGLLLGPLLYLFLLVPSGEMLVPSLQDITARFVVFALHLVHVPVFSDGIIISIPEGDFIVAEACAGLRFLIASIAFGVFFALVVYRSWWRRAIFIALSVAVPIVANGVRAFGILYLAHRTNDITAIEADHIVYGWVFFSAILLLLIFIGSRFAERPAPLPPARRAAPAFGLRAPLIALLLGLLLAASGPAYATFLEAPRWRPDLDRLAAPAVAPPWQAVGGAADSWRPVVIDPDRDFRDAFAADGRTVQRYVALYAAYGRHNNLVRSQNRIIDEDVWLRTTLGTARTTLDGAPVTVDTAEIRSGGRQRLVWYFYVVDGRITANPAEAKLRQARAILAGRSGISAFVAVATDLGAGDPAGNLRDFLAAMTPLRPYLRESQVAAARNPR